MIRLRSTLNAAEAIKQMAFGNLHDERYKGHGHDPVAFISLLREERFHHEERYEGTGALVIALCWYRRSQRRQQSREVQYRKYSWSVRQT